MAEFEANQFRPDLSELLGDELATFVNSLKKDPTSFLTTTQNMLHAKVIDYEEQTKDRAKTEIDKQKEKILKKLPTKEELINKFTSFACSPPAQKAMTRTYNNLKNVMDKAQKAATPLQQKIDSLTQKGENIKGIIRSLGEKLKKLAEIIAVLGAIVILIKAIILALGSIPPPATVPDAFLQPIRDIVEDLSDIVGAFAAILIDSLPETLADLGNLVVKIGLSLIALKGAIISLMATLDFLRKALESLYLKYLNTCNLTTGDTEGNIDTSALNFINQSDEDINNYYDETLRALKEDGNNEVIEKIYNANFQQIGYRRFKI